MKFMHFVIGHVMTGDGHPNEKQEAALKWTESPLPMVSKDPRDQARLMCSGEGMNWSKPGSQLIKKEWDMIEAWLNANIKDQEQ
jgi:hypothetical protein